MAVSEALYRRFDLKRVFYSAFINVNKDSTLPALDSQPPLRREHRLYQADFCCAIMDLRRMSYYHPAALILIRIWILNVIGRWDIWSYFR